MPHMAYVNLAGGPPPVGIRGSRVTLPVHMATDGDARSVDRHDHER